MNQHEGVEIRLQESIGDPADLRIRNVVKWCSPQKVPSDFTVTIHALLILPGRRRRDSWESESESDYDTDSSSPRRVRSRRHHDTHRPVARAAPVYVRPPDHSRSIAAPRSRSQGPPRPPGRYYDSGSDSSSGDDGKKAPPKSPPKQILYTGLACIASIAAANGIYQSAKAHHARRRELEEGEISSAEAQRLKAEHRKMDLISLGVAAVGAYNVRNGWKRAEGHWKAHKERQADERR